MKFKNGVSLLALALAAGLCAGGAQAETMAEALADTYETNPDIQSQRATLRATDEGVPQALSNWRPTVEVDGSYGLRQRERQLGAGQPVNENTDQPRTLTLSVTQNLFRGLRTLAETEGAKNRVAAGRASLFDTEQSVLLQAVTAYMNVVRDRAILDLRENNVRVLEQQLQATQDRFDVGELTRTDVAQAQSRLASAISDRTAAEGVLNSSIATYNRVVGHPPGDLSQPDLPVSLLPDNEDDAVGLAKVNNPSVVAADFTERAARDDIDLVTGELLPTLTLDGSVGAARDVVGGDSETDTQSITLNLNVPLYQAGGVYSRVREAKHTASRRLSEYATEQRQAEELARDSWADLQSARARIESFQAEVRAQEVAYDGVQQEAQVGSRTVLDVLDAEQELLNARVGLVQAQRDTVVAAYQMLSATGRLTAEDLGLPVALYDPTRHYNEVEDKWFGTEVSDN